MSRRLGWERVAGTLLLAGWALYMTVVTASNVTDLMQSFGWVHWTFRSGNLAYIAMTTKVYFHTRAVNQVLLAIAIVWEGTAAVLLWYAALRWARSRSALAQARRGLLLLSLLWFAFAICTEIFIAYERGVNESQYWTLAIAVLVTLVVIEVIGGGSLVRHGEHATDAVSPSEAHRP
ncbi:MAG TPA: DUF2165 family protein [Acidimicrobiales bacterium]|nr:DUF2165 family protein [Acidimicrobiales bacterium]